jgi:DNA-binding PadR family transcriptional regulator
MWILDSIADIGRISTVQVAILFEYASSTDEPLRITDVIDKLEKDFKGIWEPKKGTIYPSVHNLNVRGYLKGRIIKPYGYIITEKGLETLQKIIQHLESQMEAYCHFGNFIIEKTNQIDTKKARALQEQITSLLSHYKNKILIEEK